MNPLIAICIRKWIPQYALYTSYIIHHGAYAYDDDEYYVYLHLT